jgi:hypothetical protein
LIHFYGRFSYALKAKKGPECGLRQVTGGERRRKSSSEKEFLCSASGMEDRSPETVPEL